MSTTTKKMFTYNIAIMERSPGWVSMTDQERVTLLGWIVDMETLQPGPRISQIISKKKIVSTLLVWNTTTNGTTCIVVSVISLLVGKVSQTYWMKLLRYHFHEQNLVNAFQWLVGCYLCYDPVLSRFINILSSFLETWRKLEYYPPHVSPSRVSPSIWSYFFSG